VIGFIGMKQPEYLIKNDLVAIVAPAGKIDKGKVLAAKKQLENWGLEVVLAPHLFDKYYAFAAQDKDRLKDFQEVLNDPGVKAILCARGGYGTNRIIDRIDFTAFAESPKWIIGFSDITVLHSHIQRHFGIETIHGTMAAGLSGDSENQETADSLKRILFGEKITYEWSQHALLKTGKSEGIITGGNLAILCSLIGTASDVDTRGKILFIEEIGENLYRIDRMIMQLKRAGKLDSLAGLIVGGMTDIPDKKEDFGKNAEQIIVDSVKDFKYPVAFGFPAGHQEDNRALILGRKMRLEVIRKSNLLFDVDGMD